MASSTEPAVKQARLSESRAPRSPSKAVTNFDMPEADKRVSPGGQPRGRGFAIQSAITGAGSIITVKPGPCPS